MQPNEIIKYFKDQSLTEVYNAALESTSELTDFIKIGADNFRAYFENAYKKDMTYKSAKGGVTYDEFINTGSESGITLSSAKTQAAFVDHKYDELQQWHDAALSEYIESLNLEDHQENDFYDTYQYFIVPFTTNPSSFVRYLDGQLFLDEKSEDLENVFKDEKDIKQLFAKLNNSKSEILRAELVTTLDFPLKLDLYKIKY